MIDQDVKSAIEFAKHHARQGLIQFPFDAVYKTAIAQIAMIENDLDSDGRLSKNTKESMCLGLMAAKELGNDEYDFAHALHTINHWVDDQNS
jgi:hypothetical protein